MTIKPIYLHKATKYNPAKHSKLIEGAFIEQKIDGQSAQVIFNDGHIQIYTRSPTKKTGEFKDYTQCVPHIIEELLEIDNLLADLDIDDMHLQGEMYSDHLPTEKKNFDYTVGVLKDRNSYKRQCVEGLTKLIIYDIPKCGDWDYRERYSFLQNIFNKFDFKYVSLIPILGINKNGSWVNYFNDMISHGKEGVVLYDPYAKYKFSENSNGVNPGIWKIKSIDEREVKVLEIIEGNGKDKGTIGALRCIDGRGKEFKVGSFSITDEERLNIYNTCTPPFIIEMKYMEETIESYRHPIMTRLRLDKNIDDWNPE